MIRIRGLIKATNYVKSQIQEGIQPSEVASLQKYVRDTLQTVEGICQEAQTSPLKLPTRSQRAYLYLKNIDWQNLPQSSPNSKPSTAKSPHTLHLKNVVKQQNNLHQQIQELPPKYTAQQFKSLHQTFLDFVESIEAICQKNQVSPAVLATPSRKAYAWMKFLCDRHYLQRHIETVQTLQTLVQQVSQTQQQDISKIAIALTHSQNLYKYRHLHSGHHQLQLNEGFIGADESILAAVVRGSLQGKNAEDQHKIRYFTTTEECTEILLELDLIAEVKAENPQGCFHDLEGLFERLNQEYFADKMPKPRLTWNQILTHRKLGHYEPSRDRIVMSQTLDQSHVPSMVVEFVLYHELLHKHHGAKWVNGKCRVHTPEFRRDEQRFRHYQQAQAWLKQLPVSIML